MTPFDFRFVRCKSWCPFGTINQPEGTPRRVYNAILASGVVLVEHYLLAPHTFLRANAKKTAGGRLGIIAMRRLIWLPSATKPLRFCYFLPFAKKPRRCGVFKGFHRIVWLSLCVCCTALMARPVHNRFRRLTWNAHSLPADLTHSFLTTTVYLQV